MGPTAIAVLVIVAEILLFGNFDPPILVRWLALLVAAVLLVAFPVRSVLAWATSRFVITSDRVIHRSGWLAKRSMEMPLERINDVRFEQSVFERMVGAGDLIIESGGEYGQNHFSDIRRPEDVQKLIYEGAEANERRMRAGASEDARTETISTEGSTGASPLDEIERLASMKERGLISAEEFETQKRRLLGRL